VRSNQENCSRPVANSAVDQWRGTEPLQAICANASSTARPVASFCLAWQTSSGCTPHLDPLLDVLRSAAGRVDLCRYQRDPCPSWQELPPIFNRISPSAFILFCAEDVRKSCCYHDVLIQPVRSGRIIRTTSSLTKSACNRRIMVSNLTPAYSRIIADKIA
jgi:hypothetical protein